MSNKVLGHCACPMCGFPDQEVRESSAKSPKPYLNCDECGVQIFTRQAKSVRILKQRMEVAPPQAAMPSAKLAPVVAKPKPEPVKTTAAEPPAPVVAVVAEPQTEPAERTIFDWFKPE